MRKINLLFPSNFIDEKKILHIETKIHNTKIYFIIAVKVYIINLLILITKYYKL